jgi:hypothetical protein
VNPNNFNRQFELFFVLEASKYKQAILDDLESLPPGLAPLRVTVMLISGLGRLIIDIRKRVIDEAVRYVLGGKK